MPLQALIFDVDGTLAETEDAHRKAFNSAFAEFGFDWHWDQALYRDLLKVTGGRHRIRHFLEEHHPDIVLSDARIKEIHLRKTAIFQDWLKGGDIPLRPGIERLIGEARQKGVRLAVATTTSPGNVEALLRANLGADSPGWFEVIGTGPCVEALKPDPEIYHYVLERLKLEPGECIALEDSTNGLRAASAARVPVVITVAMYTDHETFDGALRVLPDASGVTVEGLREMAA